MFQQTYLIPPYAAILTIRCRSQVGLRVLVLGFTLQRVQVLQVLLHCCVRTRFIQSSALRRLRLRPRRIAILTLALLLLLRLTLRFLAFLLLLFTLSLPSAGVLLELLKYRRHALKINEVLVVLNDGITYVLRLAHHVGVKLLAAPNVRPVISKGLVHLVSIRGHYRALVLRSRPLTIHDLLCPSLQ